MLLKWHPFYVAKTKQVSGRPRKWPTHPKTQSCNGWPTPGGKYTVSGVKITFWCSLSLANNLESSDQCFYIIFIRDNKLQLLQFGNSYGEPGGWLATVRKTRTDHRSYYATGQRSGGVWGWSFELNAKGGGGRWTGCKVCVCVCAHACVRVCVCTRACMHVCTYWGCKGCKTSSLLWAFTFPSTVVLVGWYTSVTDGSRVSTHQSLTAVELVHTSHWLQ